MTQTNSQIDWISDKMQLMSAIIISLTIAVTSITTAGAEIDSPYVMEAEVVEKIALLVSEGDLPSLQAAVVHKDEIIWSEAFGESTSVEHVYMNGSVQIVFDATAVLQLYERTMIDLDADISIYLPFTDRHPDYPDTPITIRMILGHRSGLDAFWWQFSWDTECLFYPEYRQECKPEILEMSLGEYVAASIVPGGGQVEH